MQFYDDIFLKISNFGIFIRFAGVRNCQYQTIYHKKITEIPIFLVYIICDVVQFFAYVRTCSVRSMNQQKLCVSLSSSKSQTMTTWTRLWLLDPLSIACTIGMEIVKNTDGVCSIGHVFSCFCSLVSRKHLFSFIFI